MSVSRLCKFLSMFIAFCEGRVYKQRIFGREVISNYQLLLCEQLRSTQNFFDLHLRFKQSHNVPPQTVSFASATYISSVATLSICPSKRFLARMNTVNSVPFIPTFVPTVPRRAGNTISIQNSTVHKSTPFVLLARLLDAVEQTRAGFISCRPLLPFIQRLE
ncbi:hypothetical protein DFJ43DRAFT_138596 [Lentinula guzmanii]|uniref:Secreted protein n=1 Tax=Lentinula guzmanii TaxID=2804957 RepID=A0AA38J1N9_9AGAR|nr:hypothetical protein DFJ43DRAFT_138596 [Lentinula guzmanii]